jgi:hypothetical protein
MGARFLAAAWIGSAAWYGWHWHAYGLSVGAVLLRVTGVSFAGATVGKIYGIFSSRFDGTAGRQPSARTSTAP